MSSCAVLHVACHPVTGPWSVMRDLAQAQAASGLFAGVGVAVVVDDTWPDAYRQEIRNIPVTFYEAACPRTFGTAAFLYQRIRKPDFRTWIRDLATRSGTDRVIVHFHNAWLSGVFLPLPKVPGVRVGAVATFHGVNEHFEGKPVRRLIHRWMAQRLMKYGAALTSVDGLNTAVAERVFGIARSRFHVIPNGLAPVEESLAAVRRVRPHLLVCYPSHLQQIARAMTDAEAADLRLTLGFIESVVRRFKIVKHIFAPPKEEFRFFLEYHTALYLSKPAGSFPSQNGLPAARPWGDRLNARIIPLFPPLPRSAPPLSRRQGFHAPSGAGRQDIS